MPLNQIINSVKCFAAAIVYWKTIRLISSNVDMKLKHTSFHKPEYLYCPLQAVLWCPYTVRSDHQPAPHHLSSSSYVLHERRLRTETHPPENLYLLHLPIYLQSTVWGKHQLREENNIVFLPIQEVKCNDEIHFYCRLILTSIYLNVSSY